MCWDAMLLVVVLDVVVLEGTGRRSLKNPLELNSLSQVATDIYKNLHSSLQAQKVPSKVNFTQVVYTQKPVFTLYSSF